MDREGMRWRRLAGWLALGCLGAVCAWGEGPVGRTPVLLIGDSMMKLPGLAMERELARLPGVEAHAFAGIGTGLARLDAFDWMGKIDELCAAHHPQVAVVALGANDRQPMLLPGSGKTAGPSPAVPRLGYGASGASSASMRARWRTCCCSRRRRLATNIAHISSTAVSKTSLTIR